jgi:PPE-repeat protein
LVTNPHFAWLPPEINSALMFAGPGSGPLLAAAAAWNALASELASSVASFGSVTSDLASGSWLGPSSAAMMAVAAQYAQFLSGAAAQAEEAASQAAVAATAFEAALAATVQPAVVAANRALMQVLANTNWLGQNAPAIADIEAAYEQMWALDVAAMSGYHLDASAAAARLAPWRQILHALGTSRSSPAERNAAIMRHHRLGLATSVAASSLSNEMASSLSGNGSGEGNSNLGPGNAGSQNLGSGNTGNHNIGFGNLGNANIGFGNMGHGDIGFGLTGDHQIGTGGFNSGSGDIGFGNSGSGNIGFNSGTGNAGIGNSGSFNTGLLNSGTAITGAMNTNLWNPALAGTGLATPNLNASWLNPGNYVTGGLSAANLSSSVLNPAVANAGAFNPGFANFHVMNAAPANPAFVSPPNLGTVSTATVDIGTPNPVVSAASGHNATTPLLRTTAPTGFYNSGGNDSGLRTTDTGDPGSGSQGAEGIPSSSFFKSDRSLTVVPDPDMRRPGSTE